MLEDLLGATPAGEDGGSCAASSRGGCDRARPGARERGLQGAGTVHHVAWGTTVAEHPSGSSARRAGGVPHRLIDRHYFHSIYFREPGGVLFELADDGPGFTVDVPVEELGSKVILPPWLEPQRAQIEAELTPLPDPRARAGRDAVDRPRCYADLAV